MTLSSIDHVKLVEKESINDVGSNFVPSRKTKGPHLSGKRFP